MMLRHDLDKYIHDDGFLERKIEEFIKKGIIISSDIDKEEVRGHIMKSEHNLDFVNDNIKLGYSDWAIVGCYYASYHSAIALILTKSHRTKNHLATLLLLIKYFYMNGLDEKDIDAMATLLDYHDLLFYVESKNKREDASYTTRREYDQNDVKKLRTKAVLFISKAKEIIASVEEV